MTDPIIFTDDWWNWFLHTYSFMIGLVWAILKALAVLDPTNRTNSISGSNGIALALRIKLVPNPKKNIITKKSRNGDNRLLI